MLSCGSIHVIGCVLGAALLTHSVLLLLVLASSSLQLAWVISLSYKLARSMYAKVGIRLGYRLAAFLPIRSMFCGMLSSLTRSLHHRFGDFLEPWSHGLAHSM